MPRNIEIKAKVSDPVQLRSLTENLSNSPGTLIQQEDIFYVVPNGRLKMRKADGEYKPVRLYFYKRENLPGPKQSDYSFVDVPEHDQMNEILSGALGVLGVVKKTRLLHLVGQTRVHIDEVENLGHFMELEVVMNEDQTFEEGKQIAEDLMKKLNIKEDDLIECAYIDLLIKNKSTAL
ncbi:hypothetical protein CHUAL_006657 [Chamberlinius hualienensis]